MIDKSSWREKVKRILPGALRRSVTSSEKECDNYLRRSVTASEKECDICEAIVMTMTRDDERVQMYLPRGISKDILFTKEKSVIKSVMRIVE